MADKPLTPVEKKRLAIFRDMPKKLQEVAIDFDAKIGKASQGIIMIQYDMGARLADIIEDEGTYGSGAVKNLANYLNFSGGEKSLYDLRNFADSFEREFVRDYSGRAMANGQHLTLTHWYKIMLLKETRDQEKMLKQVLTESLTANELETEVRAMGNKGKKNTRQGGRKPGKPTSAAAGLQTIGAQAQKITNQIGAFAGPVFGTIDEMPPDKIDETLLERLVDTKGKLEEMTSAGEEAIKSVDSATKRVEKVLARRERDAEKNGDAADGEAEEPKKAKKKKKKRQAVAAGAEE